MIATLLIAALLSGPMPSKAPAMGPWLGGFDRSATRIAVAGWEDRLHRMPQVALDEDPAARVPPGDSRLPAAFRGLRKLSVVTAAGPSDLTIRYFIATPGGSSTWLNIVLARPRRRAGTAGLVVVPELRPAGVPVAKQAKKRARKTWREPGSRKLSAVQTRKLIASLAEQSAAMRATDPDYPVLGTKVLGAKSFRVLRSSKLAGGWKRLVVVHHRFSAEHFIAGVVAVDANWRVVQQLAEVEDTNVFQRLVGAGDFDGDGHDDFAIETNYLDRTDVHLWISGPRGYRTILISEEGG